MKNISGSAVDQVLALEDIAKGLLEAIDTPGTLFSPSFVMIALKVNCRDLERSTRVPQAVDLLVEAIHRCRKALGCGDVTAPERLKPVVVGFLRTLETLKVGWVPG